MRGSRVTFVVMSVVFTAFAVGCSPTSPLPTPSPTPTSGGALRIGYIGDEFGWPQFAFPDPALETHAEFASCCLARTLLTYPGLPTESGGVVLVPDLATNLPEVGQDSRSWTFHLRKGIHYSPPYDDVEVTAADFVAAAERNVRISPGIADPGLPYGVVDGAADFASGQASTIRGLETPDNYTLVVRLVEPSGSLNWVTDFSWAPIPRQLVAEHGTEVSDETQAPMGDIGRYWASTGPYMYERYPAEPGQHTAALVRNPSWDRSTDPRRGALVDRIEIRWVDSASDPYETIDNGQVDFVNTPAPGSVMDRYRADPNLAGRLRATGTESIWWLPMNLAVPPFDDVAVRRAVNAVINRAATVDLVMAARTADRGPQLKAVIPGHVFPDSLTQGLLVGYDPFASRGHGGDLAKARSEMSASRYDSDGDGICDAAACTGIQMPAEDPALGDAIRQDLARLGIGIEVVPWNPDSDMTSPANHIALQVNVSLWGYSLSGDDLVVLLRGGPGFAQDGYTFNSSLVGAPADELSGWGYEVTAVPSLDDVIDRCRTELGHLRARCYAELDQLVSEAVVPWVPLFSFESGQIGSPRLERWELDQATKFPALDGVVPKLSQ